MLIHIKQKLIKPYFDWNSQSLIYRYIRAHFVILWEDFLVSFRTSNFLTFANFFARSTNAHFYLCVELMVRQNKLIVLDKIKIS